MTNSQLTHFIIDQRQFKLYRVRLDFEFLKNLRV